MGTFRLRRTRRTPGIVEMGKPAPFRQARAGEPQGTGLRTPSPGLAPRGGLAFGGVPAAPGAPQVAALPLAALSGKEAAESGRSPRGVTHTRSPLQPGAGSRPQRLCPHGPAPPVPSGSLLTCHSPHDALLRPQGLRGGAGHDGHRHAEREGAGRGAHGGGGGRGVLRRRTRAYCPPRPGAGTGGRRAPLGKLREEEGSSLAARVGTKAAVAGSCAPTPPTPSRPARRRRRPELPGRLAPAASSPPRFLPPPPSLPGCCRALPGRRRRRQTFRSGKPAPRPGPPQGLLWFRDCRAPAPPRAPLDPSARLPGPKHRPGGRRSPAR